MSVSTPLQGGHQKLKYDVGPTMYMYYYWRNTFCKREEFYVCIKPMYKVTRV